MTAAICALLLPQREAAWMAATACGPMLIDDPAVQGEIDPTWFHHRNLLERQRGGPLLDILTTNGELYSGSVRPRPARAVLTVEGSGTAPHWPAVGRWPAEGYPTLEPRCAPTGQIRRP